MKTWEEAISQIVAAPGVVMVIGASDTGKSTFTLDLVRAGVDSGLDCAVVDCDIGQSDIGVPCTIAYGAPDDRPDSLSEIKARRITFVGSTSPPGHFLECANGAKKLTDYARSQEKDLIVANTTGMIAGYVGRKLKTNKVDLVKPDYLVGLQREFEADPVLIPFARMKSPQIIRIKTPDYIRKKSVEYRTARRKLKFASEFSEALGHIIRLDSVSLWNTSFRTGRPVNWQLVKSIEDAIECRVLHAEIAGDIVFAVAEQACSSEAQRLLSQRYPRHSMLIANTDCFTNLLCGLADENGNTLDVGLIQAVDFKRMFMFVLSGIKSVSAVRVVKMGSIRVGRDGRELGVVKPGEI